MKKAKMPERIISWEQIKHLYGPRRIRTTYSCGHSTVIGGHISDPSCIYPEMFHQLEINDIPEPCSRKKCNQ